MANDDEKPKPPNPLEDVRKGLGLLFRAAKTVAQKLPTDPLEKVVLDGAREVGRAVENVATTIENQVFKKDKTDGGEAKRGEAHAAKSDPPPGAKPGTTGDDASESTSAKGADANAKRDDGAKSDDGPKPRVG